MARSVWKGPFVCRSIYKLCEKIASGEAKPNERKKIWARGSVILPDLIGRVFLVYNGKIFIPVTINDNMVGKKFGEYAPTRTFKGHTGDKKVVKKK
jgi:small subunit ribosomal protein S19